MKVTDRLIADHKAFRKILDDIDGVVRQSPGQRDVARLRRLAALLKRMVASHAQYEDGTYFPALDKKGGLPPALLSHLSDEHKTIGGYLDRLETQVRIKPPSQSWPQTFALLSTGLKGHFKREEEEVFPASERLLGEEALHALGAGAPEPGPAE